MNKEKIQFLGNTILKIVLGIIVCLLLLLPFLLPSWDGLKEAWGNASTSTKSYYLGFLFLCIFLILKRILRSISEKIKIPPFLGFMMYFLVFILCSWFTSQLDIEPYFVWQKFLWICLFVFPWYILYYLLIHNKLSNN
jgi:hypothetical protein